MSLSESAQYYGEMIELTLQRVRYSLRGRFSHANEQNILAGYIEHLLPPDWPRTVVDIGAGNGVRWSNSYALLLAGWKALGIEADSQKFGLLQRVYRKFPKAQAANSLASPHNISALLRQYDIEPNFGVLCLDIDGNDYWVLDAILSNFRPGLVVTEINENIPPPLRFVVKFDPTFQLRYHFYGYSIAALEDLCAKHQYGILELEYNNAFLAPKEIAATHFRDTERVYRQGYLNRPERQHRFASNADMEELHSLNPEEGVAFLQNFYASDAGNYYLATKKSALAELIRDDATVKAAEVVPELESVSEE
jgi:predicted RNA methylase